MKKLMYELKSFIATLSHAPDINFRRGLQIRHGRKSAPAKRISI